MSRSHATRTTQRTPRRVAGPVLVSNLVAGALLLLVLVLAILRWPLAVVGAAYVAGASMFLAAVYARPVLTRRQEATVWVVPWLAAVVSWAWAVGGLVGGPSTWLLNAWFGVVIATPGYVAWQALALAVRQLLAWRATMSSV